MVLVRVVNMVQRYMQVLQLLVVQVVVTDQLAGDGIDQTLAAGGTGGSEHGTDGAGTDQLLVVLATGTDGTGLCTWY